MSGSRGIRPRGAPNNLEFSQNYTKQRYQHQQPFSINPTPPTGNWSDDTWGWSPNIPNWDNQPNNQTWPSAQHYRGRGGHQYGRGDYKFPQRPNYNPSYRNGQGDLANGVTRGSFQNSYQQRGTGYNQRGPPYFPHTNGLNASSTAQDKGVGISRDLANRLGSKGGNSSQSSSSKIPTTEASTTFRPPNIDLTNRVKEKLKMFQAAKDQNTVPVNQIEAVTSSSPSTTRTRESRVSGDTTGTSTSSPSSANIARDIANSNRPAASSSSVSSVEADSVLEGIGFIQRHSSVSPDELVEDRSSSVTPEEDEGQTMVSISKEEMNRYIKKMDNHQRRQLIEQPRGSLPQYMLDHLIHENHAAKARQLSTIRFRQFQNVNEDYSSNSDLDSNSRDDQNVIVPQDFLEQVKELLECNEENQSSDPVPTHEVTETESSKHRDEDDEILFLDPPVKEPPPCIDLDLDDSNDVPSEPSSVLDCKKEAEKTVEPPRLILNETSSDILESNEPSVDFPIVDCVTPVVEEEVAQVVIEKPDNRVEESVPSKSSNSINLLILDLQMEESRENMRLTEIDRKIKELQKERKLLVVKIMSLQQQQFDALRSNIGPMQVDSSNLSIEGRPEAAINVDTPVKAPVVTKEREAPAQRPAQLMSLMQQLEENGVDVALGESSSKQSGAIKRKRTVTNKDDRLKKKTNASFDPIIVAGSSTSIPLNSSVVMNSPQNESLISPKASTSSVQPSVATKDPERKTNTSEKLTKSQKKKRKSRKMAKQIKASIEETLQGDQSKKKTGDNKMPKEGNGKKKKLKKKSPVKTGNANASTKEIPQKNVALVPSVTVPQIVVEPIPQQNQIVELLPSISASPRPVVPVALSQSTPKALTMMSLKAPHDQGVRCMFVLGSILFTASKDGTVLVHDLETGDRAMRLTGHEEPITWLYAVLVRAPAKIINANIKNCLDHLDLVTGSEDGCIRQFTMRTGECRSELACNKSVTCVAGDSWSGKLYVGSVDGTIYTYNPKVITVEKVKFKADREIMCLKVAMYKNRHVLIVSAKQKDPFVYDLTSDEVVLSLTSNSPGISIRCISVFGNIIFCCDAKKNVFTFDWSLDKTLRQVDILPSSAIGSFHCGNRFLFLGCVDGVIRVMDTQGKPPAKTLDLPTSQLKSLGCIKVADGKVFCGTQTGELLYFNLADVEGLMKSSFRTVGV